MSQKGKGTMTTREAGKRGGEARKLELGSAGYAALGHKGGQRVKELIAEGRASESSANGGDRRKR